MIKVFWHESDNFGDKITPYILDKLEIPYQYVNKKHNEPHYIMCGSILTACNEHTTIWGAGIAQEIPLIKPKEILAVRGVKTRDFILKAGVYCPEVYWDPGQILPLLYWPSYNKYRTVGYLPHIIDYHKDGHNWDLNKTIEATIDYICSSERIESSSLHACIVADAYGIPYKMIKSPNVIGQQYKFDDFMNTEYDIDKFVESFPFKDKL